MSKHTSGTWRVVLVTGSYKRPALVMAGDKLVASCLGDQLSPDATSIGEAAENARLIAAAPEMLAALRFLLAASGEQLHSAFEMAEAAIAKATGEKA